MINPFTLIIILIHLKICTGNSLETKLAQIELLPVLNVVLVVFQLIKFLSFSAFYMGVEAYLRGWFCLALALTILETLVGRCLVKVTYR